MGLFDKLMDDVLGDPFGTYHQADQARIAGEQQAALADEGVREARRQYNFGRLAMQPYTDAGYEALGVRSYLTPDATMSGYAGAREFDGTTMGGRVKPGGGLVDNSFEVSGSVNPSSLVPRSIDRGPRVDSAGGVKRVPAKNYTDPGGSTPRSLRGPMTTNTGQAPSTLRQLGQFGLRSMPGLQDQAARGAAQMGALEAASDAGIRGLTRQERLAEQGIYKSAQGLDDLTVLGRAEMQQQALDAQRGREAQARLGIRDEAGLGASDRAAAFGAAGLDSRGRVGQFEQAGVDTLGQVQGLAGRTGAAADRMGVYEGAGAGGLAGLAGAQGRMSGAGDTLADISGAGAQGLAGLADIGGRVSGAADRLGVYEGAGAEGLGALGGFSQAGADALEAQRSLAGLNGAEAQAAAMADIENDPEYQMLLKQGEEAILQNASATGGLRGGRTQEALADLRSSLAARQLDKKYSRLGQLAQQGADISRFMSGQGQQATSGLLGSGLGASQSLASGGQQAASNLYSGGLRSAEGLAARGQQATSNVLGLGAGAAEGLAARGQQASMGGAQMGLGSDQFLSAQGAAASGQLMGQGGAASRGLANMGYGTLQNRYATGVDLTRNLAGQGLNTAQYMTGLGGNLGQYLASTGANTLGDIARMGQASAAGQATLGQNTGGQVANLLGQKGAALAGGRIAGASGGANAFSNMVGLTGAVSGFF